MSHINRAVVQVPAFFLITGIIVVVNLLTQPEPTPVKNPRTLPPRIVFEHSSEGTGEIRAELETVKIYTEQMDAKAEPPVEYRGAPEKTSFAPM